MSCYETHRGILHKVDTENRSAMEYLADLLHDECKDFENVYDIIYSFNLDDKYIYINGNLYEWINHSCKFDEEEDFCELTPLEDGSFKVFAQFYNGGCCLEDLLENKLNDETC